MIVNIRKNPSYDVYIGRYNSLNQVNLLSNAYQVGVDGERLDVVAKYAYDFTLKWKLDARFRGAVLQTKSKILGCFCHTDRELCHGMVIEVFLAAYLKRGYSHASLAIDPFVTMAYNDKLTDDYIVNYYLDIMSSSFKLN